jgi:ketosteroid isomerase-like protein
MNVDEFVADVLPRLTAADTAMHDGDPEPRKSLWSRTEPVTLFGAAASDVGRAAIEGRFDRLGTRFSDCRSFEYEVVAAGVSGDLGYLVGTEHTTASIGGGPPVSYSLRVTTVLRREAGEWRVVHRHADQPPGSATEADPLSGLADRSTA